MEYYMIYKPFGMLSQFTREAEGQVTLADLDFTFPKDVYPIGRLDSDSEGLLLLTNNNKIKTELLDPKNAHWRTYLAQVEGMPGQEDLEQFRKGITFSLNGKPYRSLPAKAVIPETLPELPERNPPVRFRKSVPDGWLQISLTEGKNRQVRKMCAAAGFPVLRLIRIRIGKLDLGNLQPGEVRSLMRSEMALALDS